MELQTRMSLLLTLLSTLLSGAYGCENGDVRLVDGFDENSGRVEFCYDGEWGTVCDDDWKNEDARVVCRQLGLATDAVSYLSSFGGGNGSILIDNADCTGDELRLEDCIHNGVGHHDCMDDHTEDAGVICDPDVHDCTLVFTMPDAPPTLPQPVTRTCLQRYGSCVPYRAYEQESLCDEFYTSAVDYVYVPRTRHHGRYSRLMSDIVLYGALLLDGLDRCYDAARRVICHFYLPPCGNSTQFKPPTSVCPDMCQTVKEMCGEEWENVAALFDQNRIVLELDGMTFIDCADPGKHLYPVPYQCDDLNISAIPTAPSTANTTALMFNNERENSLYFVAIPMGLLVIAAVIVVIVTLVCVYRKHLKKRPRMSIPKPTIQLRSRIEHNVTDDVKFHASSSQRYTFENILQPLTPAVNLPRVQSAYIRQLTEQQLLIPRHKIKLAALVGQGEFGVVYKATLDGWHGQYLEAVAVKTLKAFSDCEQKRLIEESLVMAKFDHLNVMKLIGVSPHSTDSLYIVMPYMIHGSLLSYLRKQRADLTILTEDNLELVDEVCQKLWSICLQIAKGMRYLASLQFLHRDLAARNCMTCLLWIDENFVIKVSDFGLSEDIYARNYFRQGTPNEDGEAHVKLPVKWMALESLNDRLFTEKSDVWSFGITCWEVFSLGKTPYPGMEPFSLVRFLERGERLEKPLNTACSQEVYSIIEECWNGVPEKRPTFSELVIMISTSLEGMAGYLDLTILYQTTEHTLDTDSLEEISSQIV